MYKLILIGGNRLKEDGPITKIYELAKKNKIKTLLIVDKEHLKKECKNKNLKHLMSSLKVNFEVWDNLKISKFKKISNNETIILFLNCKWKATSELILYFKNRIFNYHAASLPELRGAANISWKILMQNSEDFKISIHRVTPNYDDGVIIISKKFKVNFKNKRIPQDFLDTIMAKENNIFDKFISFIKSNQFPIGIKQIEKLSFYWPRLNSNIDGRIQWDWSPREIINFIRAFSHPFEGAFTYIKDKKLRILDCHTHNDNLNFHPFQNGLIYRIDKQYIFLVGGKKSIKIYKKDIIIPQEIKKLNLLGKKLC